MFPLAGDPPRKASGPCGCRGHGQDLTPSAACHIQYGMKMTMHIDEDLLRRVMDAHDCASKTEAVDMALREMARKADFRAMVAGASPFSAAELKAAVEPSYDITAMRAAEPAGRYKGRASHAKRKRSR